MGLGHSPIPNSWQAYRPMSSRATASARRRLARPSGSPRRSSPAQTFPYDDVGAHNKLRRFFATETRLDYDRVERLVAPWQPCAGMVYFHLLLASLSEPGVLREG